MESASEQNNLQSNWCHCIIKSNLFCFVTIFIQPSWLTYKIFLTKKKQSIFGCWRLSEAWKCSKLLVWASEESFLISLTNLVNQESCLSIFGASRKPLCLYKIQNQNKLCKTLTLYVRCCRKYIGTFNEGMK